MSQAAEAIRRAGSALLVCHVRPDADALGSLIGLMLGLEHLGKRVSAVSPDGVPAVYRFLPHWERLQRTAAGSWDVAIGLDADGSDRLGPAEALLLAQPLVVDLDHHTGSERYGQIQVVDVSAAAVGELVFDLLGRLDVPLTPEIATCLLAAVLTDTGGFRFNNVTPETFRIAALLVEAGAHPAPIHEAVYGTREFAASRLLGRLLTTLDRSPDGRVVWGALGPADFRAFGVSGEGTEGFVDQLRVVHGAEVAVFFREEHPGEVRVSLRSRGKVNVARIAEEFGGGGHVPASGCTLLAPLEEAVDRVIGATLRHVREG